MNRNQVNNAAFAAAYINASLFDYTVTASDSHTFDDWPVITTKPNDLFPEGFEVSILPDEEFRACDIVPPSLTVEATGYTRQTVQVDADYQMTIARVEVAVRQIIETAHVIQAEESGASDFLTQGR